MSLSSPDPVDLSLPAQTWAHDPARQVTLHGELVEIALRWLRRANSAGGHGCQVALSECWVKSQGERPDAIGWRTGTGWGDGTVLVGVKTSRADFLADARKPHRLAPSTGVGRWRYYLCPEGLIQPDELPERWGLLWVGPRKAVHAVAGPAATLTHHCKDRFHESRRYVAALADHAFEARNMEQEMGMLARLIGRCPDLEVANRALRDAQGINGQLVRKLEAAREQIGRLQQQVFALRVAAGEIETGTPIARRTSPSDAAAMTEVATLAAPRTCLDGGNAQQQNLRDDP